MSESFCAPGDLADVRRFYADRSRTPATPLLELPALAAALGVGRILLKDESDRFGLPAFKTVGVRYAVARLLAEAAQPIEALAAATAGNHGRAVARAARDHGLAAHIYVPAGTEPARVSALRREGAEVTVTPRPYDDTVRLLAADAREHGWTIVSDTAWAGYEEIPRWIMAGYTQILEEIDEAGGFAGIDPLRMVVLVQAGVGSLAGAVAGWLVARFGHAGDARPTFITVEPAGAACVLASLRAGERTMLAATAPTSMAGLRCGEVSTLAWPILQAVTDGSLTVTDAAAAEAVDRLANPLGHDLPVRSGPSGAAGVAALMTRTDALPPLGDRTVLVINTEGPIVG